MEKTLIVLIGNARGGEDTWETMYKNLKEPFNADIALCLGENPVKSSSLYKNAKYVWELKEYDNWLDYYNIYYSKEWFEILSAKFYDNVLGGINNFRGSGAILLAFRHFLLKNYKHILMEYDRIILTRTDYYYIDKHPVLPNDSLYIVEGEDYEGVCDRHHIFNKEMIDDVLGVCDFLCNIENCKMLCNNNSTLNIEKILLYYFNSSWVGEKIKRVKRVQFAVGDTNDTTRWQPAYHPLPGHPTLKIKYITEYEPAMWNLRTQK